MPSTTPLRYIIFDLDETLYPRDAGVMKQIDVRMTQYMVEHFGMAWDEAHAVRRQYWEKYGTTLAGLRIHMHLDASEFLTFVHDIPIEKYLVPNGRLSEVLSRMPWEKVVFTNASHEHARRVLDVLGIAPHFSRIFDITDVGYHCKPDPEAYRRLLQLLEAQAEECIMVEDSVRNLAPAKALGMGTVLVGADQSDKSVDFAICDIAQIGDVVERLSQKANPILRKGLEP